MARDLIPPPSPAGRPPPDPQREPERDPEERPSLFRPVEDEAPVRAEAPPEPEPAAPSAPAPYRSRFGFVLGALIGVGLATVALLAVLLVGSGGTSAPSNWSAWKPTAKDGLDAARQIADHVGPKYRLGNGDQLVAITSGPLEIPQLDLPFSIAMRTAPTGGDIKLIEGRGVLYTLNGLGPRGSITKGKASEERHLLLRREALELSLYTFRYIEDVDIVVALLPPKPPEKGKDAPASGADQATQALFYRPGDLEPELEVPLGRTIPARTPRPETLPKTEAQAIEGLTRPNLFLASFQQGQDAHAFLVLDRLPE